MLETLASHLDSFAALAPTWGLAFVFFFMAVESSFIPFPSEVVMIPAGFIAARGEFGFAPLAAVSAAVAVAVAGSLAGAYVNYYLANRLGKPFLVKYGKWFFVKPDALERACEVFNSYGEATTFVCRLVPVIRQLISIPAGIARMPLGSFSFFTALGSGIWSAILAAAGFFLARTAGDITYRELVIRGAELAKRHLPWVVLGALALAVAYIVAAKLVMRRGK
ncbi:MAG: DedA family protein [Kiritimatiellae bacterium]|nr:DedA family protein [Kiritimatiellia bacterium]